MTKRMVVAGLLVIGAVGVGAKAQGTAEKAAPAASGEPQSISPCESSLKSYVLKNVTQPNDGNEIQTSLRNLLPPAIHIFFVGSQNTIFVCAGPEWQTVVERVVKELDRPRNRYRLTYTFTESEGGKRMGTQHFTMLVTAGQRMTVKEGSRVPIATGSFGTGGVGGGNATVPGVQTQYQYVDVGMNFDVTLSETAAGGLVKTKVEESSIVPAPGQNPVIRQVTFEGSPMLVMGKPAIVTSLDMPEGTRHVDVEVMMEAVP